MYHYRKLKCLLLLLLVCVVAKAQPEAGTIYRFVNKANPEQSLAVVSETKSSVSPTADHYLQYWLLETHPGNASTWTLRNLGNGKYLQRAGRSVFWGFVDAASDATPLYYLTQDGYCTFSSANNAEDGACMHYSSSQGGIVGWDFSADATQWTMTEISSVTADDLTANWEALDEFNKAYDDDKAKDYASALDALFTDAACTTLESTYVDMSVSAIQEDANYKALPAALQELVLKVLNGDWTEANFVDGKAEWESEQAKKFRVQLYEPHSIAGDITSWLGINAHNNMDNPTGIFASYRDVVYVMVEGTIKEGASLYLYGLRGHGQMGNYNDGNAVQLHEGLNVVPYISDGNALWINYVVDTYNGDGSTDEERFQYKLSSYEPLKINIAGGHINGYYNAVGDALWGAPDNDNDWTCYKDRASLESFTLLSHRVTMQFYMYTTEGSPGLYNLLDNIAVPEEPYCFSGTKGTPATFSQYEGMGLDASTGKINIMLEAWNRIAYSQFATLGVLNEATIDKMNEKYPRWYNNWTERGKIYDYTTGKDGKSYEEYCGGVDYSEYFNHHCLAISNTTGYMSGGWKSSNYNINTAESIIDKIANEAGPVWGPAHEIGHQHQSLFTLNGLTEVTNNLHSNVAVWYMGMGTSRMNGTDGSLASVLKAFNTEGSDYYTNNIWALTQMYYRLWLYYHLAGNNTQFYPRLMENLRREPLEKGYNVGPGGLLRFYKHCCVAAGEDLTEFFRAHGLLSVMTDRFVGDYSNSVYNQSQEQIDAAIAEVKALGLQENIAPLFISDATPDTTYRHDGTTQRSYWDGNNTTSGNNAEVGSYIDFVNGETVDTAPTLTIKEGTTVTIDGLDGVGIAIFNEKGEIVGFSTKSTFSISSECAVAIMEGTAEIKALNSDNTMTEVEYDEASVEFALLGGLLEDAKTLLALSDSENKKPGFYKTSALEALRTACDNAQEVYDSKVSASYSTAYEILYREYVAVQALATDKVPFLSGSTYVLTNKSHSGKSMAINAENELIGTTTDLTAAAQQWTFEPTGTADTYYLKNVSSKMYLGSLAKSTQVTATATTTADASSYKLFDLGDGLWALQCQNEAEELMSLHCNGSGEIVGWWHTANDNNASWWYLTATTLVETDLPRYELEDLIAKTEPLMDKIAEVQYGGEIDLNFCNVTSNAPEEGHGIELLYDNDPDTYFHSVWRNSAVNEAHYVQVDLGESKSLAEFVWTYTTYTTDWAKDFPTTVEITGSNDLELWSDIKTLSDLPTNPNTEYSSETLGSSDIAYRYLRFTVTSTLSGGKFNNQYYFGLAEFGLERISSQIMNLNAAYAQYITSEEILTACEVLLSAKDVCDNSSATEQDYRTALGNLQTQYDKLLDAYNDAKDAVLEAKMTELKTLITNTTDLIASCATIMVTKGSSLILSTTAGDNVNYLTAGPNATASDGALSDLIDTDSNTSFTSNWSSQTGNPYLQVQLPNGQTLSKFTFTFTARNGGGAPTPSTIVVSGSNDGQDFAPIATFTMAEHGFPAAASGEQWTSPDVIAEVAYEYLRFTVTKSERSSTGADDPNGYYHFGISHFGISTVDETLVTLKPAAGGATVEDVLAAYNQNVAAQTAYDMAVTENQVQKAIDSLQEQYNILNNAKNSVQEYTVSVVGDNGNGGVVYNTVNYTNGQVFSGALALTVGDLTAIPLDGYTDGVITMNGTAITVTYQKVYTVQVNGGDDTGGVTYDGNNYLHDATITVSQDIDVNQLTAIEITGYNGVEVTLENTTITVTYRKVYTVQVDGGDDTGGVTYDGNDYVHDAEIPALATIELSQLTAIEIEGYVSTMTVDDEKKLVNVSYCKLVQNLSELRNYKVYHIRARSGEGYFAYNSSVTEDYVSLRGVTDYSYGLPSDVTVANKYKEAVDLSDKTVVWQIIKEDDSYYLYQPVKGAYVTRSGRDYKFIADKTALDGIRQNSEEGYTGTFGIHAGGDYSDDSQDYACIVTGEATTAVRDWEWTDHGAVLQIIENPYVYAVDYQVEVVGADDNGGVVFEEIEYDDGSTISATEFLIAGDLAVQIVEGYNGSIVIDHENATITVTYAAIPLVDTTKYYTLACKATDHETYIRDNGTSINGRSAEGSLFQFEAADEDNGYYIKSYVSEKYLNCTANDNEENDAVVESEEKSTVWKMAKHTEGVVTLTAGYDKYLNNNGGAPTYLLARYHNGGPNESNACSLWTLTEGEPLDMSDLAALIEETNNLIASCYTDDVLNYVNSAYVTEASLTAVREVVADAQARYESKATVASEYTASMTALQEAKDNLTSNITLANTEATERDNQRGVLNELIGDAEELITLCGTTPGDATQTLIAEVSDAVTSARTVADNTGSTVDELTDAITALQAKYDVLIAAQQSTAKDELRALIEQTNTLIADCGTVTYGVQVDKTPITLQTTDEGVDGYLYCNAPYLADENSGDYSPASEGYHILDNSYTTYLHTDWSDNAPNEDHYLRVSLGSIELSQFVLMYSTRGGGGDVYPGNPKQVVVEGCATAEGEYTEIAVLTSEDEGNPLPQGSALSHYTSAVLDGTGYKFIRFRVTMNQSNRTTNGHHWFYISEFSLASAVQTEGWSVTFKNGVGRVTEEQLIAIYQKNDEATELANTSYDKTELDAAKAELQSLYDALSFAKLFPIELTTDAAAPVLYTIKTKRDGGPVLQYETESGMFSVVTAETGKATQAFYFMRGDENQVYIYPYMAGGKVLAANDVENGDSKALAMEKNTATYEQWVFVGQADGYYNLQPVNSSTYLSNIYGTSHKMGFYGSSPDTDKGSLFKFESTTVEGSYYYLKLKDYYENQAKVASSEIQGGSGVGYYPTEQATAYNTAYAAATEVLASADNTDEAYQTAYNALVAANDALVVNMPEEGKFYRLRSIARGTEESPEYAYVKPEENKMYHSASRGADDATTIWSFTETGNGTYKLTNLHTGTSLANNGWENYKPLPLYDEAEDIEIVSLSGDGQVGIWCGDIMLHADGNGKVVRWPGDAGSGSAWRIVEVEDMSLVNFSLTVSQYRHAGLYLNYATKIPVGVKVYIAHSSGDGFVVADELEGTILPARTAVIVKGEEGSYDFKYTAETYDGTDEANFENNVLGGSAYLKYRQIAKEGNLCCIFGQKSGEVGLYKNWVGYTDANGSKATDENEDGKVNEDSGTYFKISANKIYFEYEPSAVSNASSFLFRLNDKDDTSGLDRLIMADGTIIYNLYGQRLSEVVVPGFYIINGKKIYVDEKVINNKK